MADIIFVAIVIAFFAAAGGFVVLCDRIIGPAEESVSRPTLLRPVEDPPAAKAA